MRNIAIIMKKGLPILLNDVLAITDSSDSYYIKQQCRKMTPNATNEITLVYLKSKAVGIMDRKTKEIIK